MHSVYSRLFVLGGTAAVATVGSISGILLLPRSTSTAVGCAPTHVPIPSSAKTALARYLGSIRYDRQRSGDGLVDESWSDAVTQRTRNVDYGADGKVQSEFVTTQRRRTLHFTTVDYSARNWMREQQRLPYAAEGDGGAVQTAQGNFDRVAEHKARIVGKATVDGRSTLHLVENQTIPAHTVKLPPPGQFAKGLKIPKGFRIPPAVFPAMHFHTDTWVDPVTYLPVRTGLTVHGHTTVTDERWLPRTPANLAKTEVVIPRGFRHLVPRQGRGYAFGVEFNTAVASCPQ